MNEAEVRAIERSFWLEGPEVYERLLAPDAIVVLPGSAGILPRNAVIESIRRSPRWDDVSFESMQMTRPAPNVVLLAYEATGERDGGKDAYRARCGSMYVMNGAGEWMLAFHQQTSL